LRRVENKFFKLMVAVTALVFIDRHLRISFTPLENHGHYAVGCYKWDAVNRKIISLFQMETMLHLSNGA